MRIMNFSQTSLFDSVILAGGFGSRLKPLTDNIPKPLLEVAGESALLRVIKLLRANGFTQTAVTTMFLPEKTESALAGTDGVVCLRESAGSPLGSAGAVASLCGRLSPAFCVISGDAVCDFALREPFEEFARSDLDAAMVLAKTDDAGEYGTVRLEGGIITGFCEKPSVRDTLSDLVNTGIYFLRGDTLAPFAGRKADFGRDVFPALLKSGKRIGGVIPKGHWFDIGSFYDYHSCCMHFSGGANCAGRHVSIHPEAEITRCVLFSGVTVGKSVLSGSIIGENAVIGNGCFVPPGCVIGGASELRDGAALAPGSVIAPGSVVYAAKYGGFGARGGDLEFGDDCLTFRIDTARGKLLELGAILAESGSVTAVAESGREVLFSRELACGAAECGALSRVITGLPASAAAWAAREFAAGTTAHIAVSGDAAQIRLYGADGMPLPRSRTRGISHGIAGKPVEGGQINDIPRNAAVKRYTGFLKTECGASKQPQIRFAAGRNERFARECAAELGAAQGGDAEYSLSADGARLEAKLDSGRELCHWQLLAIYCSLAEKPSVALPNETPEFAVSLLRSRATAPCFYGDGECPERAQAAKEPFSRDGTLLAFALAARLAEKNITLSEAAKGFASFSVQTRTVLAEKEKMAGVISSLVEEFGGGRCVGFDIGDARVSVFPSAAGAFKVTAEAFDAETAEEISLLAAKMIEKRL